MLESSKSETTTSGGASIAPVSNEVTEQQKAEQEAAQARLKAEHDAAQAQLQAYTDVATKIAFTGSIEKNSIGTPELHIDIKNGTDKTIDALVFETHFTNNFGDPNRLMAQCKRP
jgi:hypothetical protein